MLQEDRILSFTPEQILAAAYGLPLKGRSSGSRMRGGGVVRKACLMCLWQAPELLLRWFLIMVLLPFWAVAMCLITALAWYRQRQPKGGPLSMKDTHGSSESRMRASASRSSSAPAARRM
jgi:hypothetical protein